MIKLIIKSVILTIIIVGISFGLKQIPNVSLIDPKFGKMVVLLFTITVISQTISYLGKIRKPEEAIFFSFAAIGIHFILNLISITILIYQGVENRNLFFFNFFVLYLCYTLFDISSLITNLRQNS